ncbi:hypothetical protein NE236_24735 [Actinoallomurus purpureus]|uniref:proline-rich domain-containing protein n=1 Tax=Actinoallomurus purpureus TaxID=478114 RepID=UPI0020936230|nr:proline-rich domain-containing protein [Actinoallomurus purpureus]MCO6008190.1 hypothetical protein [Actinoallomurus purpureus]
MTVEPVDRQSLLERRSLLFSPDPRLGWVFRDRWAFYVPFTESPPQPQQLPQYLHQQVVTTRQALDRHRRRTLPLSITAFAILALFSACAASDYEWGKTSTPLASFVLALICLGPGVVLTAIAANAWRAAREAYETARRRAEEAYGAAMRDWQARKNQHEAAEHHKANGRPEWGAVPRPLSRKRLDVFGGTLWSWEALLTTYGSSALFTGPLLVIDLSREMVCGELATLSRAAGIDVDAQLLPAQLATSTLLSGLEPRELADAIVESMYGGTPDAARADRSMDDRILTKVCDALGDDVSLARIGAALRALMGEPDDSTALDRDERRRIANELFSVEYRRQAHANLSRVESYVHPLEQLGTRPERGGSGYLTCIALDSSARNVRSELLTDLIVQWVTHRIAASGSPRPSVVVAGADELARRHLERLSDACERRGIPLTFLFRRLRETGGEMIGGGAVAFMRLGNHEDAARAADFIGRDYRFVLSQITKNVGGNESHTESDTEGEGDSDSISLSTSIGTSTNWGTTRSSGATRSGGGPFGFFADRSTNTGDSRTRGGGTSETDTHGESRSVSRNWSSAYSYAVGTNWSDADTTQRVYEYAVEPVTLQHLPDHAVLLVESHHEGGRKLTAVECDPAIVTLHRVATTPLPDPPRRPRAVRPPAGVPHPPPWAAPQAVEPPREPLPYAPGPPPGSQSGPRPPAEDQDWRPGQVMPRTTRSLRNPPGQDPPAPGRGPTGTGDDRPGPPPLFGSGNE